MRGQKVKTGQRKKKLKMNMQEQAYILKNKVTRDR